MSINKVLNRPMFRREALRKGHLKPIRANTGVFAGPPAVSMQKPTGGPLFSSGTKGPFPKMFSYNPVDGSYLTKYGANQLRRFPGVQITGNDSNAKISIRGINSMFNQQGPLFYINNSPVGNDYSLIYNMVDPNDIKTIKVLKEPTELQRYGFRGSNGVIIIKLK